MSRKVIQVHVMVTHDDWSCAGYQFDNPQIKFKGEGSFDLDGAAKGPAFLEITVRGPASLVPIATDLEYAELPDDAPNLRAAASRVREARMEREAAGELMTGVYDYVDGEVIDE